MDSRGRGLSRKLPVAAVTLGTAALTILGLHIWPVDQSLTADLWVLPAFVAMALAGFAALVVTTQACRSACARSRIVSVLLGVAAAAACCALTTVVVAQILLEPVHIRRMDSLGEGLQFLLQLGIGELRLIWVHLVVAGGVGGLALHEVLRRPLVDEARSDSVTLLERLELAALFMIFSAFFLLALAFVPRQVLGMVGIGGSLMATGVLASGVLAFLWAARLRAEVMARRAWPACLAAALIAMGTGLLTFVAKGLLNRNSVEDTLGEAGLLALAGIPIWIYLLAKFIFNPIGFWQNFFLLGVGFYFLGLIQ